MNWLLNLFQSIIFQTVISGVLVFVLSEIIQKFFLEPFRAGRFLEVGAKHDHVRIELPSFNGSSTEPIASGLLLDILAERIGDEFCCGDYHF